MSKARGSYYERALVKAFKDRGLEAWRVPLSGALGESESVTLPDRVKAYLIGDVCVCINQIDHPIEVKFRSTPTGFTEVYKYMAETYERRSKVCSVVHFRDCTLIRGVDAFIRQRSGLVESVSQISDNKLLNTTLTNWLDQCKILALRSKKEREWYFICI